MNGALSIATFDCLRVSIHHVYFYRNPRKIETLTVFHLEFQLASFFIVFATGLRATTSCIAIPQMEKLNTCKKFGELSLNYLPGKTFYFWGATTIWCNVGLQVYNGILDIGIFVRKKENGYFTMGFTQWINLQYHLMIQWYGLYQPLWTCGWFGGY